MYVSKYKLLESRLEETVQQMMKVKEEKITTLENKVEESNKVNTTLRAELTNVRTYIHKFCFTLKLGQCSVSAPLDTFSVAII